MSISDIKIKKIIRTMDLGEFQKEYAGTTIEVWVNPPIKLVREVSELSATMEEARVSYALLLIPAQSGENSGDKSPEPASDDQIAEAKGKFESAKRNYFTWYAKVWQDSSEEEVLELAERLEESDPTLLFYLRDRTQKLIRDYLASAKKG